MSNQTNNIQAQLRELDTLLAWFDSEEFELEQAVDQYKKAEALAARIKEKLSSVENEITVLARSFERDNSEE